MRNLVLVSTIIAIAGVGMIVFGGNSDASNLRFEPARVGRLERHVVLQGPVMPARSATIAPRMPSRVARLYVREGQHIARGARVILLDASELSVDVERKRLALERARLRRDERAVGRFALLEIASSSALEELEIKLAQLELQRAESMLSESILTSPIDGTVVQLGAREGEMMTPLRANAGEGVIIAGTGDYVIKGELDEYQAGEVTAGASATITFEAVAGASASGTVVSAPVLRRFRPDARQAAVFEVTVALKGKLPTGVTAGHTGTAKIRSGDDRQYLLVPVAGILHANGTDYVVERGARGALTPRQVELGPDDNRHVAIIEGLQENASVAVGDLTDVRRRLWPAR